MNYFAKIFLIFSLSFLCLTLSFASDPADPAQKKAPEGRDAPIWDKGGNSPETNTYPVIEKLEGGILRIGNLYIDKNKKTVTADGFVNMTEGLVEYLACGSLGKLHESVLVLDIVPYYFQIALLLIDLEPGDKPIGFQGATETPMGDPLEITVSWKDKNKKEMSLKAETLLFNKQLEKPAKDMTWVFAGSQILDGNFMAQIEQSIVATYHDPYSIIDHTHKSGADDTMYFVNKEVIPPKGTPIKFTVKALKK